MPDYSKTLIYQIVYETKCYYVGATTNFTRRKTHHKNCCNDVNDKEYNLKSYTFMRANGWTGSFEKRGWDMILIEAYPCKTKKESSAREYYHYSLLNPSLNSQVPSRTAQQYNLIRRVLPTESNDCNLIVSQENVPSIPPLCVSVLQSNSV